MHGEFLGELKEWDTVVQNDCLYGKALLAVKNAANKFPVELNLKVSISECSLLNVGHWFDWFDWLPVVVSSICGRDSNSTGTNAFFLLHGWNQILFLHLESELSEESKRNSPISNADRIIKELKQVKDWVQSSMAAAQDSQEQSSNKNRKHVASKNIKTKKIVEKLKVNKSEKNLESMLRNVRTALGKFGKAFQKASTAKAESQHKTRQLEALLETPQASRPRKRIKVDQIQRFASLDDVVFVNLEIWMREADKIAKARRIIAKKGSVTQLSAYHFITVC
ncbi:hypothetical protein EPUL_002067 [Erysiphe pulchra]|uniref:Uncharacterized protein n=1 Tax=Erysiphe pulchra TaxID=225359 RepID=A0A2S4PYM8_9PEZI|nr:hypothetical protein EPUL_002067 [Erysiphe pulchra]